MPAVTPPPPPPPFINERTEQKKTKAASRSLIAAWRGGKRILILIMPKFARAGALVALYLACTTREAHSLLRFALMGG